MNFQEIPDFDVDVLANAFANHPDRIFNYRPRRLVKSAELIFT